MSRYPMKIRLPLGEPIYSTYHCQGSTGSVAALNPTVKNYYYNRILLPRCNKKFRDGYTSPELNIQDSWWNPYLERIQLPLRFLKDATHSVICTFLSEGYYVSFNGIDDYYLDGKTWFRERHFSHDGLIFGYDSQEQRYSVLAYDKDWVYRPFYIPRKSFAAGRRSGLKLKEDGNITAYKVKLDIVELNPAEVLITLRDYLEFPYQKSPKGTEEMIFGLEVTDNMIHYLSMLEDGSIPYERMDWRVFRMIWEHKKAMYRCLIATEEKMGWGQRFSPDYAPIVADSDRARMLYAAYHLKRRDTILSILKKMLSEQKEAEKRIITSVVEKLKEEIKE